MPRCSTIARLGALIILAVHPLVCLAASPPSLAVGIQEFHDSLKRSATQVGSEALDRAPQLLQQTHLLIERFRNLSAGSLNKPFRKVGEKRQTAFQRLAAIVDSVRAATDDPERWDDVRQQVRAAGDLSLDSNGLPMILSFSPVVTAEPGLEGTLVLTVRGTNLESERSFLELDGVTMVPQGGTEGSLVFVISGTHVQAKGNGLSSETFLLSLTVKKNRLPGVGIFAKKKRAYFELVLYVLPEYLGTYSVIVDSPSAPGREKREVQREVTVWSKSVVARNEECYRLQAAGDGWKVDTSTIEWDPTISENAEYRGVKEQSEEEFCLLFSLMGRGIAKGKGRAEGIVHYTEFRDTADEGGPVQFAKGDLRWGTPVELNLPPDTTRFVVEVKAFDGGKLSSRGTADLGLVEVHFDEETKLLRLRSKDID